MIEKYQKVIALVVTVAFLALLPVYALPVPVAQVLDADAASAAGGEQTQNFVEREQQGYQASSRNLIPVLIGVAAVAALVFLLVILVSKEKYDLTGDWDFHNDFSTPGYADFDSVWTFTANDDMYKQFGTYIRRENGVITIEGQYTVVDKVEVVFQDYYLTEQYVGRFDSKTTMSGTFVIADGAEGTWTATKR